MSAMPISRGSLLIAAAAVLIVMLAGCASPRPAPVSDARPAGARIETPVAAKPLDGPPTSSTEAAKPADSARLHVVQRSETLYSIAFQNGLDIRELAAWNNIVNPAVIRVGDTLRLTAPGVATGAPTGGPAGSTTALPQVGEPVATPLVYSSGNMPAPEATPLANSAQLKIEPKAGRVPYSDAAYTKMLGDANVAASGAAAATVVPSAVPVVPPVVPAAATTQVAAGNDNIVWAWPVKGKLLTTFTDVNKGIDIAGTRGTPILAAAPGKVIYNESALRGYGRLVIIKHSDNLLSAYAHNEKVLVTLGQDIRRGQKIAEMGSSDADAVKLHFEIRLKGKPVDPLKFLPPQ